MKKFITLAIVLISLSLNTYAQQLKKTMYLDKIDTICTDTKVDFNVRANNFSNIIGFQGSIGWDSTIITFDSLMFSTSSGSINLNDSNTNIQTAGSYINYIWFDSLAHTVPNNTILFTLRFSITNPKGNKTPIFFNKTYNPGTVYTSLEIDTMDVNTMIPDVCTDTSFIDGYIGFVDTPKIIQNGNVLTCIASCNPSGFQWYINGNPIPSANSNTITVVGTGIFTVSVSYTNGNKVFSLPMNVSLPLQLLSFNAAHTNNATTLKWSTTNEVETAYFNIGRKVNDGSYETIGTVAAKGSSLENIYTFNDKERKNGTIYYQLEMVDKDGSKHYSNIVSVNVKNEYVYSVYPNPSHNKVNIEGESINQIDIVDNVGHLLIRKRYAVLSNSSFSAKTLDIKELKAGMYFVKIYNLDGSSAVEKLIIN